MCPGQPETPILHALKITSRILAMLSVLALPWGVPNPPTIVTETIASSACPVGDAVLESSRTCPRYALQHKGGPCFHRQRGCQGERTHGVNSPPPRTCVYCYMSCYALLYVMLYPAMLSNGLQCEAIGLYLYVMLYTVMLSILQGHVSVIVYDSVTHMYRQYICTYWFYLRDFET